MSLQTDHRDDFLRTLAHIEDVAQKIRSNLGRGGVFTFPDQHKIAEGLFLSAWTHWEEFLRTVLIDDLATEAKGFVRKDVREFRVKGAPRRLAERILFHPDHPTRFVEWDFGAVKSRADEFLPDGHRFSHFPTKASVDKMKRIRNAVAHKSDRAWESFMQLVKDPPFNLSASQRKGLTVGRFLVTANWGTDRVIHRSIQILSQSAGQLVP